MRWSYLLGGALAACGPVPGSDDGTATVASSETTAASSDTSDASTGTTLAPTSTTSQLTTSSGTSTTDASSDDTSSTTASEPPPPSCGYALNDLAGPLSRSLDAADFDQDGHLDVVTLNETEIQLFFGDGSGVQFTAGPVHVASDSGDLLVGDFDGDGAPDLVHQGGHGDVSVFLNIAGDLAPPIVTAVDGLFYTFRVADADADDSDDISYGGWHGDPVHVWLSSAGTLSAAHQLSVPGCYATASDWADYDGDGDLDLAVTGGCNGTLEMSFITVHLRDGTGFIAVEQAALALNPDNGVLEAGDYDGDGRLDIVTQGGYPAPAFELHRGLGDATFAPRELFPLPERTQLVRAVDADADGRTDLLADAFDIGVVLLRSEGDGFTPCLVGAGRFAEAADFDEDGRLDLLLAGDAALSLARPP